MTDAGARLLDEISEQGLIRRIEYVRDRMRGWGQTTGDLGHIDVEDAANLDHEHPLYVRADHPALAGYYARIGAEALQPAEPDDPDELRRRANLDWTATAAHEPCGHENRTDNADRLGLRTRKADPCHPESMRGRYGLVGRGLIVLSQRFEPALPP